jgi:predicted GNAT family acetyltransferase
MEKDKLVAQLNVARNEERSRYEITLDGRPVGFADYRRHQDTVVFPHTVIEPSMRGQGFGAELVRRALDDVRAGGGSVVAQCWYVSKFIDEHPEYADLLATK